MTALIPRIAAVPRGPSPPEGALFVGRVSHKRLRPREHALSYAVMSMLIDLDAAATVAGRLRLLSLNRFNVVSFHERDHGPGAPTGLAEHVRGLLAAAGISTDGGRVLALCYPRILGYVFNPLTVYYGYDAAGRLAGVVYEVNNTFGERRSYVVPAGAPDRGVYAQACGKELFVSPFASGTGRYGFRITEPGADVVLAVLLRDEAGPLIKALFTGASEPLTDARLVANLIRLPLMTLKVIAAIHLEALKLWWKGVPLVRGHRSPRYSHSLPRSGGSGT